MELLYVWVEEYGNIKRQGFNFSPNYDFEGVKNEGYKTENTSNLFGNSIKNITAIVGKNGSGKSTLLKIILKKIAYDIHDFDMFDLNSSFIHGKYLDKNNIYDVDSDYIKNIRTIYYDNLNENIIVRNENEKIHNLSYSYEKFKFNSNYNSEGIKRQIDFWGSNEYETLSKKNNDKNNFWKIPSELKIYIASNKDNNSNNYLYDVEMQLKTLIIGIFGNEIDFLEPQVQEKYKKIFFIIIVIEFMKSHKQNVFLGEELFSDINNIYEEYIENMKQDDLDKINAQKNPKGYEGFRGEVKKPRNIIISKVLQNRPNISNDTKNKIYRNIDNWEIAFKNYLNDTLIPEFVHKVENIIDSLEKVKPFYRIDSDGVHIIIDKPYFNEIKKLIREKDEYGISQFEFLYKWNGLSSGEEAILSIFSKLYSIKNKITEKNILILLDEPENYLHPEWQRKWMKLLVEFINEVYKDKKVQIILTSHSPFVASDLPKENIIMLDVYDEKDDEVKNGEQEIGNCKVVKDKDIKTFGANIFDLYTDAFFVESSFGEFAKGKIKEVVNDLTPNEKSEYIDLTKERINEIEYILNSIGEPLVKNKLQKMYDEYKDLKEKNLNDEEKIKLAIEKSGVSEENFKKYFGDKDD